jgi:hypothetical protein
MARPFRKPALWILVFAAASLLASIAGAQTRCNEYTCSGICGGPEECTSHNVGVNTYDTCRHVSTNNLTATNSNIMNLDGAFSVSIDYVRGDCAVPRGRLRIRATVNTTYDLRTISLAVYDANGTLIYGNPGALWCSNCQNTDVTVGPFSAEPKFVTVTATEHENYPGGCISNCLPTKQILIGQCLPGCASCYTCCSNPGSCNDGNGCTTDTCSPPSGGCTNTPNTGAVCDDGDPCTISDTCRSSGSCRGVTNPCDDANACTTDGCSSSGGGCFHQGINCADTNPCTTDTCSPAVGCQHGPATGPACNDGNACTTGDACWAGTCYGGAAPNCNDGNACTVDGCSPSTGCTHTCAVLQNCSNCEAKKCVNFITPGQCTCSKLEACGGGHIHFSLFSGNIVSMHVADPNGILWALPTPLPAGYSSDFQALSVGQGGPGEIAVAMLAANNRYWTVGGDGIIRATATAVGPAETFFMPVNFLNPIIYLRASNGRYVDDVGGLMHATSTAHVNLFGGCGP